MTKPGGFSQFATLLRKDLKQEFRTRNVILAMALYAVLVLIVYGATVATSASNIDLLHLAAGLFWAMLVFTSLLGLNRTFNHEKEEGALAGLLVAPVDRSAIFFAKAVANIIFLLVVQVVCIPLFWFLFLSDVSLEPGSWLVLVPLVVGTIGIAGMGTFLATITTHTRGKDVLLAILLIPLIFPLLYACVSATGAILVTTAASTDTITISLVLAAAYDVIMFIAAWALYGFVIEA